MLTKFPKHGYGGELTASWAVKCQVSENSLLWFFIRKGVNTSPPSLPGTWRWVSKVPSEPGIGLNPLPVTMLAAQLCPTLYNPTDCSPTSPSVHVILQAIILECVAIPFSRGSSWPRDQTCVSHTAGRFFTLWDTREALQCPPSPQNPWTAPSPTRGPHTINHMFLGGNHIVRGNAGWNHLPWPDKAVATCTSCLATGGPGKEWGTN